MHLSASRSEVPFGRKWTMKVSAPIFSRRWATNRKCHDVENLRGNFLKDFEVDGVGRGAR